MEWKEVLLSEFLEFNPKRTIKKNEVARKITMDLLIPHSKQIYSFKYEPYTGGAKFSNGDTIMARITPCLENGKHAYVSCLNEGEIAYGSTEYIVLCGKNGVSDNEFVYYLSHTPQFVNTAIKSMVGSSGRQRAQVPVLENLIMPVPVNLSDQRKIAGILSDLDSKIENNNKINANLEAQAQALFKSWFVDFTPFKDQPFVDSELGPIPQGWKVVSLDEVCLKITDGSHFSPKDNPKEKIPMLSVKDMRKHGFDYQSCKHITESDFFKLQKNDCVPHVNDLLVAKDGSYLKEIFLCKKEIKQAILSSIAIFRPNTKLILPEYLLHYLKQPQVLKDVRDNYVSGSAVPRIVLKDFKKLKLCIPPMNSISTYRELLKSIEKLLLQKTEENQRLAALRDTLLPKLMSGEIKL